MPQGRRQFHRKLGKRRYRKLFIIAAEGKKTEPQYFAVLNNQQSFVQIECLRSKGRTSSTQVLERMENRLKQAALRESDEAWLVVDRDQWTDDQLADLHRWSQTKNNYGFALSNPKFEYWIVLHFEDGSGISNSRECSDRLRRYLPNYSKNIDPRKITQTMIAEAIRRARERDNPSCIDWPRTTGTTVYRLVERILADET
jgi:uncharacterized protein YpiB (UPF0302 family)